MKESNQKLDDLDDSEWMDELLNEPVRPIVPWWVVVLAALAVLWVYLWT
jgi:hypothetical protein